MLEIFIRFTYICGMARKKDNRGGARPNSGAKKKDDTKQPITFYLLQSVIDSNGGKEAIKQQCINLYK